MKRIFFTLLVLALALGACGTRPAATVDPAFVQTALAGTLSVINQEATLNAAVTQTLAALNTATSTSTPEPTLPQSTVTPIQPTKPAVLATVLKECNCRLGVFKLFPSITILKQGDTAAVIGKNNDNGLWYKLVTSSGECWVASDLLSVEGDTTKVQLVKSPATPTPIPAPTWGGKWRFRLSSNPADPETSSQLYTVTLTQKGKELTGSFVSSWSNIYMIGYISSDGMTVSGELYPSLHTDKQYRFYLYRSTDNSSQFRGYYYVEGEGKRGNFCGVVFDGTLPVPCQP